MDNGTDYFQESPSLSQTTSRPKMQIPITYLLKFGLISLFNGISTFEGYVISKPSL